MACAVLARDPDAAIDIHVHCTPAGEHGFGWHYDAEEVFIVLIQGRKEFAVRKNTVNPLADRRQAPRRQAV